MRNAIVQGSLVLAAGGVAAREPSAPHAASIAGVARGQNAVASYLVGTIAQCTWLQGRGHTPAVDLRGCVQVFGHRGFNALRRDQFAQAQPVRWRAGLSAEHVIND